MDASEDHQLTAAISASLKDKRFKSSTLILTDSEEDDGGNDSSSVIADELETFSDSENSEAVVVPHSAAPAMEKLDDPCATESLVASDDGRTSQDDSITADGDSCSSGFPTSESASTKTTESESSWKSHLGLESGKNSTIR